jgi:hypothetical protein
MLVRGVEVMKNHDVALVVPSIREASLKRFIDEWRAENLFNLVDLVIVEDNPKCTFQTPPEAVAHFDWSDIDDRLGKDSWIAAVTRCGRSGTGGLGPTATRPSRPSTMMCIRARILTEKASLMGI